MREWYVIRLGRPVDQTKVLADQVHNNEGLAFAMQQAEDVPRRVQRGERRNEAPQGPGAPIAAKPRGHGYYVKPGDREDKSGSVVHTTEEAAESYASELAAKYPGVMFGVFSCIKIFETTTPTIITKTFNDSGELVIEKKTEYEVPV